MTPKCRRTLEAFSKITATVFLRGFGLQWKCSTTATRKLQNIVFIQGMLVAEFFHFGADGFERRFALVDDLRDQAGDRARIFLGKPAEGDRRRAQTDTAGHEPDSFPQRGSYFY